MTQSKSNEMGMEQEIASQVVGLGGSTDFTLLSLFLRLTLLLNQ